MAAYFNHVYFPWGCSDFGVKSLSPILLALNLPFLTPTTDNHVVDIGVMVSSESSCEQLCCEHRSSTHFGRALNSTREESEIHNTAFLRPII